MPFIRKCWTQQVKLCSFIYQNQKTGDKFWLPIPSGSCADNRLVLLHVERKQELCQQTADSSSAGNSSAAWEGARSYICRHLYSPFLMFMTLPPPWMSPVIYKWSHKRKSYIYIYIYIWIYALKNVFSSVCESITEEISLLAEMVMTGHIYTSVPLTPFIF